MDWATAVCLVLQFDQRGFAFTVSGEALGPAAWIVHSHHWSEAVNGVTVVRHVPAAVNSCLGDVLLPRHGGKRGHTKFGIGEGCHDECEDQGLQCPLLVRGVTATAVMQCIARVLPSGQSPKLRDHKRI